MVVVVVAAAVENIAVVVVAAAVVDTAVDVVVAVAQWSKSIQNRRINWGIKRQNFLHGLFIYNHCTAPNFIRPYVILHFNKIFLRRIHSNILLFNFGLKCKIFRLNKIVCKNSSLDQFLNLKFTMFFLENIMLIMPIPMRPVVSHSAFYGLNSKMWKWHAFLMRIFEWI